MKLYTAGVKVPRLGSLKDRVVRDFMDKESEKETKKVQLLALIATNIVQCNTQSEAEEWNSKVKKVWSKYLELEYGVELPEHTEQEMKMMEYYSKVVKKLKPKIHNKKGEFKVTGLEKLGQD